MTSDGGVLEIVLLGVGLFVVLRVFTIAHAALQLRRIRVRPMSASLCADDDIPATRRALLEPAVAFVMEHGFVPSHSETNDGMYDEGVPGVRWTRVYYHEQLKTWARISTLNVTERFRPFGVEFITELQDGTRLVTVDDVEYALPGPLPRTVVQDVGARSINKQWGEHQRLVSSYVGRCKDRVTPDQAVASVREGVIETIEAWEDAGILTRNASGERRFGWMAAVRMAKVVLKRNELQRNAAGRDKDRPDNYQVVPPALLASTYRRQEAYQAQPLLSSMGKLALLIGSMLLFAVSFGLRMDWFTVVAFLVILFIHEGGHLLGMRLFGYGNLQVLFLPFLGAATVGRGEKVPPTQRIIVSLMGPIPGILIGLALMAAIPFVGSEHVQELLWELSALFLALNLLNLLPIMPLDGGHVLNDLALSRRPRARAAFTVFGALVLLLLGLLVGDTILIVVAPLLLLGVRRSIREARLAREVRSTLAATNDDDDLRLVRLFEVVEQSTFGDLPFAQKFPVAKRILQAATTPDIAPLRRGMLTGFYAGALLTAPAAIVLASVLGR